MRFISHAVIGLLICGLAQISLAARIKDITNVGGVRNNQLVGYGLVVGLDGTGDKINQTPFTQQSFVNMLLQFGIRLPFGTNLALRNVAAVAISANLPPFARIGQKIDITVASLGNATSLRSGELLMAPLRGADGKIYAMAQGSVVVSGFGAQGSDGSKVIVNSTGSGRIPNGATVEKTILMPFARHGKIIFELNESDFTTALLIEQAINKDFKQSVAKALDASSVEVQMNGFQYASEFSSRQNWLDLKAELYGSKHRRRPMREDEDAFEERQNAMAKFVPVISRIQNLEIEPAHVAARVIANSRTGTIVVDEDVRINPVAVTHGNLSVQIQETPYVSQPNAFANGRTVVGASSNISIDQTTNHAFVFAPGASLKELVDTINSVGAAPGDLIAILEAIKSAGALQGELEII